jgi:hypothetical protein
MKQILLMIVAVAFCVGCGIPGTYMEEARRADRDYKNRLTEIDSAFKRGDITETERQRLKNEAFKARR